MDATLSVLLHTIEPLTSGDLQELHDLFALQSYEAGEDFGFRDLRLADERLSATLVRRMTSTFRRYDVATGALVEDEVYMFYEIPFALDALYGLLEVYGPATDASRARAVLRSELRGSYYISPIELAPVDILPRLRSSGIGYRVGKMTIHGFEHEDGVVGRYQVDQTSPPFVSQAMSRYGQGVTRAQLEVTLENRQVVALTVSSRGQLRITGEETELAEAYVQVKEVLFGQD